MENDVPYDRERALMSRAEFEEREESVVSPAMRPKPTLPRDPRFSTVNAFCIRTYKTTRPILESIE